MRLTCLSGNPNKPCYVLRYKGVTVMLDCGLDLSASIHFLPLPLVQLGGDRLSQLSGYSFKDENDMTVEGELKEGYLQNRVFVDSAPEFAIPDITGGMVDFAAIDAILISNYTCMLALPYITEETGFRGMIFMTEPTLQIGRLFMEEMIEYIERSTKGERAFKWKDMISTLPPPLCDVQNPQAWRTIYTRKQMESSLSKVQLVGYSEKKDIFGLLQVSPASSGYCLGSSNWIISSDFERIAYVSGSSTLTTHPRPIDQSPLRNVDCLLLTGLIQTPLHNPDPMIGEFCKTVVETTKMGGNVLVPCYSSGINYDLFECLALQMDHHGLCGVPMFFISPVADSSLAYSNIMAEWLSTAKQNRVYLPEEPFPHGHLSRTGRLKSFRTLHDENFSNEYRQPCVMFCGHPSLRFGDVIHFIELWGSNQNNTLVFTEPSFNYSSALAPFQPLHMKTVHCPIDTGLNFVQAKKLIRDLRPGCLAIPEAYAVPPPGAPGRSDITIETDIPTFKFSRYETIKLPLKSKFESITIDPKLAAKLIPQEVRPGVAIATITGNLVVTNNKFELRAIDERPVEIPQKRKRDSRGSGAEASIVSPVAAAVNDEVGNGGGPSLIPLKLRRPTEYLYGKLNVRDFVQKLGGLGIADARVEELSPGSVVVHLDKEETIIQVEDRQTHVFTDEGASKDREMMRKRIRDVLIESLNKF